MGGGRTSPALDSWGVDAGVPLSMRLSAADRLSSTKEDETQARLGRDPEERRESPVTEPYATRTSRARWPPVLQKADAERAAARSHTPAICG